MFANANITIRLIHDAKKTTREEIDRHGSTFFNIKTYLKFVSNIFSTAYPKFRAKYVEI